MVPDFGAASTFRLDVKGAEIRHAFERAGIRSILLKGPALGRLLYAAPRSRSYSDVDLLIDPDAALRAERILTELGFRRLEAEATVRQIDADVGAAVGVHGASHATAWLRERDGFIVDLHDSLPQVGAPAAQVWAQITHHLELITVGGTETETLDAPAAALLTALHAAHHGVKWDKSAADLIRAVDVFDRACWQAARDLAVILKAEGPMGVGLGLIPAGRALAQELSLPTEPTRAHRLLWRGAPWSAIVLASLSDQRSLRARAALLARILCPSPAALRRGSELARRGLRGLLAAYALRALRLGWQLPAALRASWRREL